MLIKKLWKYTARKQLIASISFKDAEQEGLAQGDFVEIRKVQEVKKQ